ncbi:MAG: polysaccharide biosynthesis tyrosine autokinase [Magnetococcales bacterium]|nr:polysaccharide biosynthesis tyrosine autokinase [Magnetococcales bacterium]
MAGRESPQRDVNADDQLFDMEDVDLSRIVYIIRSQIWGILALSFTVGILVLLLIMPMKYYYISSATIKLETQGSKLLSIDEVYGVNSSNVENYQTQIGILGTRKLAEDVIERLNLVNHPEFRATNNSSSFNIKHLFPKIIKDLLTKPQPVNKNNSLVSAKESARVFGIFNKAIKIRKVKQSQLVHITAEFHDAKLAARVVNAMAEIYILNDQKARLAMTQQATGWLTERLEELKKKLSESEEILQRYRDTNKLVNVKGVTSISAKKMDQAASNLINAQRTLEETRSINDMVARNRSISSYLSEPAVLKHPLIQRTRGLKTELESKISTLKKRYGRKHPKMISANTELEAVKQSLKRQVQSIIDGIKKEYDVANATAKAMQYRYQAVKDELTNINRKEHTLKTLEREVETNRNLYNMFLTRYKETDVTSDMQSVNARIVDHGVVNTVPSRPRKKLIVMLAMILAAIAGIFIAFLQDYLDDTIKDPGKLEKNLALPLLGMLPLLQPRKLAKLATKPERYLSKDSQSIFAEAIRKVRTNILLFGDDDPGKIIVVTSSVPGEGKTTFSSNLAIALSMNTNEKVLLIDADMRRPSLDKVFEINKEVYAGLSSLLVGYADIEHDHVFFHDQDSRIQVLYSGVIPPNPLELLASDSFTTIITSLTKKFDRIVIDTAPVQAVSDAIMISSQLSSTLVMLCNMEKTPLPIIKDCVGQLKVANVNLLGIVLNRFSSINRKGGYGYKYGYSAYGGYNYTDKSKMIE